MADLTRVRSAGNVGVQVTSATDSSTVTAAAACDGSAGPANGGVGSCTSLLAPGSSCQPTCGSGFVVSGATTCSTDSQLSASTCEPALCSTDGFVNDAATNHFTADCAGVTSHGGECTLELQVRNSYLL
jgi:hypothetical protein